MPKKEFVVTTCLGKEQRLDIFLTEKVRALSRSQIKKLIEKKKVRVDGVLRKSSYKLQEKERVEIDYERPDYKENIPENIPLELIYTDEHIVVINKPSGLVVHPGAGYKEHTLVNALLYYFPEIKDIGPDDRPGIVHRLDKETSGVMVVAKTSEAYRRLQRQFKQRKVQKLYLCLVWGKITAEEGRISWSIGRHPTHGERMSIKSRKPRKAETLYSVKKRFAKFTLLEVKPLTGRTHQIRVHLSASGHPLVGDTRYGRRKSTNVECPRLFLHAFKLLFNHPETQQRVEFSSPLPQDLKSFLENLD